MKDDKKPITRRRPVAEIKALLKEQASSNTRVNEFCKTHQISRAVFYNWRIKYSNLKVQPAFVPAQLAADEPAPEIFAEITFPQQVSVRLFRHVDPGWVKAILKP